MSTLRTPKNFDAAVIALHCPHPYCTYKFMHTGEAYRGSKTLTCPECGGQTPVDLTLLVKLHQSQLKLLRQAKARLRSLGI